MGIPLALLAFGPQQMGAAVALFSISNLIHFSIGARITSAGARTRDLLLSPMMLAAVLGFASALTDVRPPQMLLTGMRMLGDASLPMMLFALGARLCSVDMRTLGSGVLGALARPLIGMALAWPLANWLWALKAPRGPSCCCLQRCRRRCCNSCWRNALSKSPQKWPPW
jgi:hypothetical protein